MTAALPIHRKHESCILRTILFYDPQYMRRGGMMIGGQWVQRPRGTTNRGLSTAKRAQLVE
eukprot:1241068-Prorocentrum_lima.AAC.1